MTEAPVTGGLQPGCIAQRVIQTAGDSFVVRGLTADSIFELFQRRGAELSDLYQRLALAGDGSNEALTLDQSALIAKAVLNEAPQIAAEIIAMGSGAATDEAIALARLLPLSSQLAAIVAIAEMTFSSEMPPKKVIEIVAKAMGSLSGALADLKVSPIGSGASASS